MYRKVKFESLYLMDFMSNSTVENASIFSLIQMD